MFDWFIRRKKKKSNRAVGIGIENASGNLLSAHDLRCMEVMGIDLKKAFPDAYSETDVKEST
jgi:hypothetical protein